MGRVLGSPLSGRKISRTQQQMLYHDAPTADATWSSGVGIPFREAVDCTMRLYPIPRKGLG